MPDNGKSVDKDQSRKAGAAARAERLAAELRENLKKRKEQARARERAREPQPDGPKDDED